MKDSPFEIPDFSSPQILLAHGGGGHYTRELLEEIFLPLFNSPSLEEGGDGAYLSPCDQPLAISTDSFVVNPPFFPGGDIGKLAVWGTVNDLAMCGARPLYLTASFILEEGFLVEDLWKIAQSMKLAAKEVGIEIVTGDTKVVARGQGDGIFINTTGVGPLEGEKMGPRRVEVGDQLVISGDIGRHGMAIMAVREGLEFETTLESDCTSLWERVQALFKAGLHPHCLRDLTRGGLGCALAEIAEVADRQILVDEEKLSVPPEVREACEILGLNPLHVACEGRLIAFLPAGEAERAREILSHYPGGKKAAIAGEVEGEGPGEVVVKTAMGSRKMLPPFSGEQLPRIC